MPNLKSKKWLSTKKIYFIRSKNKWKKLFLVLVVLVGFAISANSQYQRNWQGQRQFTNPRQNVDDRYHGRFVHAKLCADGGRLVQLWKDGKCSIVLQDPYDSSDGTYTLENNGTQITMNFPRAEPRWANPRGDITITSSGEVTSLSINFAKYYPCQ